MSTQTASTAILPPQEPDFAALGIERELITQHLEAYCARKGSQGKAAAALGISSATLSQIVNRKWKDVSAAMWRKLAGHVLPSSWKLVNTGNFATITSTLSDAQEHSLMRWVSGYSGAGKTTALRQYASQTPNVAYVLCLDSMSVRDLFRAVLAAIGVSYNGTKYEMLCRITDALMGQHKPLLVLDDAGKLNERKLHIVQQIYDLTEGNCGIVMAGVDYAYDNLVKAAQAQRPGAPELKRRVGYNQKLKLPTQAELEAVARANGIEDTDVLTLLRKNVRDFGTLRDTILNLRRKENPTAETLRDILGVG